MAPPSLTQMDLSVCGRCGAAVADPTLHVAWHDVLEAEAQILDDHLGDTVRRHPSSRRRRGDGDG